MKRGYVCDTCGSFTESTGGPYWDNITEAKPWSCPVCGKEACWKCFWKYAAHKACCEGKTDAELIAMANTKGFNFEVPNMSICDTAKEEG